MRRLPMRKIAEVLRLKATGLSTRKVATSLGLGQSTVSEYIKRAERAGLSWPLPESVSDVDLEGRLFEPTGGATRRGLVLPDWAHVHRELRRKGVTLALLWEEYKAAHPADGYGYGSRFVRNVSFSRSQFTEIIKSSTHQTQQGGVYAALTVDPGL